jgi:hypothetical protein
VTAQDIRLFFRDLFGSRLVATLERSIVDLRQDYERRMNERDETIACLRRDLADAHGRLTRFEEVFLPKLFSPKPEPRTFEQTIGPEPGSWAAVQAAWYKQEAELTAQEKNNGIQVADGQELRQ